MRPRLRLALVPVVLLAGLLCGVLAAAGRGAPFATTPAPIGTTAVSTAHDVLVVSGHGWGHGLGMSQYGAYGYAAHGWTYDRILAHYYTGTTLGQAHVASVRVLVADERKAMISSAAAWTITDAVGAKTKLAPGTAVPLTRTTTVGGVQLRAPLTVSSTQPLAVDGHAYRGRLTIVAAPSSVQVVDVVGLEAYVKGVVPAEMPSAWPAAALQAQAVATRSYALANVQTGTPYDLYGDTRSQVYGGVAAESPAASAAVDATRGQVALYAGKVADTLFFSTSGGRTATAADATGHAVPYLVAVADPYDTLSPYHSWGPVLVDAARLQRVLGLAGPVQGVTTALGSDGRVAHATIAGPFGARVTITGSQARTDLDLRSTWFTVGQLALTPATAPVRYGGAATLSGVARGEAGVSLEARVGAGPWQPAGAVAPAAGGAFSVLVHPATTTQYRLAAGGVRAAQITLGVAPQVSATVAGGTATGTIQPALAGAAVQLQQSATGTTWQTVGTGVTDAAGAFSVAGATSSAGTYRVRVAPGHGLVPGTSKPTACC